MIDFAGFMQEALQLGRVGDDLLVGHGESDKTKYQCMSIIKYGWKRMGDFAIDWPGNAIDLAKRSVNPLVPLHFYKVESSETQAGDIIVLRTAGYNGDPEHDPGYGHVAWSTGGLNASDIELLEQNGQTGNGTGTGGDAIRTRWVKRTRVACLWRWRVIPTSQPTCIYRSYAEEPLTAQIMLTAFQPTNWWNLNVRTTGYDGFQAAGQLNADTPFPIGGYAHHINNDIYAMSVDDFTRVKAGDLSTNNGINLKDLKSVPPPPPMPAPPAAPVPVPLAEKLDIIGHVNSFPTYETAVTGKEISVIYAPGSYYVHDRKGGMILISPENMKAGTWIRSAENVPDPIPVVEPVKVTVKLPKPAPLPDIMPGVSQPGSLKDYGPNVWKSTAEYIFDDHEPITLTSTNTRMIHIKALDGGLPTYIDLPKNKELKILKSFKYDGIEYYQDKFLVEANNGLGRFYALPASMFPDPYEVDAKLAAADSNRDGKVSVSEFVETPFRYASKYTKQVFTSGRAVITTAMKSPQTKRFIDGIKVASKKNKG